MDSDPARLVFFALSVLLMTASCDHPSNHPELEARPHRVEPVEVEPAEVEPAEPDACALLRTRAAALLATPSAGCETDDGCDCYPAFIDCGGVRDAASASAYQEIASEGQAADCGYVEPGGSVFNCAPWECIPTCIEGRCGRGRR